MRTKVKIDKTVFQAAGSQIIGDVEIGENSSVWYNAVLRADSGQIRIGKETNIQDNCVLHMDAGDSLTIGDGVTVGHGVILHGCTVGDNTVVGMGSIILEHAVIGKNCIIGAGTLITQRKVIPDGSMVYGNPAKIQRSLTEEEIASNRESAEEYLELSKRTIQKGL